MSDRRTRRWTKSGRRKIAAVLLAGAAIGIVPAAGPAPAGSATRPRITPYRGLGTWVDIYDPAPWDRPGAAVKSMKRRGVRTLFLQTGNYHSGPAIFRPPKVDRFIQAAHRRNMRVVAWYLPSFVDPDEDFRRSMAAIRYRTAKGHRFDGFGLDIEATSVSSISDRIERMLNLSRRIRSAVGSTYSLGAIVPSPYGMKRIPSYWGPVRDFPWEKLARIYDTIAPMSYFSWRVSGLRAVYHYNAFNVTLIRKESENPEVPIHLIGGIADDTTRRETRGYVRAVRTFGTPGGSYYDFTTTSRRHWRELKKIPVNPRQSPPLPVRLGNAGWSGALGNVPGADRSHPKEVFFRVPPRSRRFVLKFDGFDVADREVELQVNWRAVEHFTATPAGEWGERQQVRIAGWRLRDDRSNIVSFVARGNHPAWSVWGVRAVQILEP